jgi:hypothetical protein
MPRRDWTGPMGLGSMTGRGFGTCNTAFGMQNSKSLTSKRLITYLLGIISLLSGIVGLVYFRTKNKVKISH